MKLASSALLWLKVVRSGAAFWVSAADMFRLASKYFGRAATAIPASQLRHNKSLHPTACSPLVPRSLPAAGEFKRCGAARGLVAHCQSTLGADAWSRWMRVLASAFLRLMHFCSGAAFWVSGGAAFRFGCGFWFSADDTFRLWSKYFGGAAAAIPTHQLQHNKALHPTAYSFVPSARASLRSLRFRRRVSLSFCRCARLGWNC